jgi:RNA polymerase sigma factor (sigma-70 family)
VRTDAAVEDLLRPLAPRAVGALVRRYGDFDACEDAVQEALLAAAIAWPDRGVPESPLGWLITVGSRRLTDAVRSDRARRLREEGVTGPAAASGPSAPEADAGEEDADDTLTLLFLCAHPALSPPTQLALTLRSVGGLTTAEVARAFLVPEATMAQRISRAKQRLKAAGARFEMPPDPELTDRLRVVLHVLYLIFNEGYTATSGADLQRADLRREAIRLTRLVRDRLPEDGEVAGLLALMLLIDARSPARAGADGGLIPLADQDRSLWNRGSIDEGVALLTHTMAHAPVGPYQLQAAIAAVHAEAASARETDWAQIVLLYELLEARWPNPMVTLNRAVAVAMVRGPQAGLELLDPLCGDGRLAGQHRMDAVRAHLLEMSGDTAAARDCYLRAARLTTSLPERRYLESRAGDLV